MHSGLGAMFSFLAALEGTFAEMAGDRRVTQPAWPLD
jgi:hypothetical protein